LQTESNTSMPVAFLMQQIEWRENFDDARQAKNMDAMADLETQLRREFKDHLVELGLSLDQGNYAMAAQQIRACMFLEKFTADIAALEEQA
jgi:molecular chaperone HscB